MSTDTRSVDERLNAQGAPKDASHAHEIIGAGMRLLAKKVYEAFPLTPHPLAAPVHDYGSPDGNMRGSIRAFRGGLIDWAIDSWIAAPKGGFCNHHLTLWLTPEVKVPHLGLAIGTIPQLFFYCDIIPRGDLWTDTAQLDRYHGAVNQQFMDVTADPRFKPFVSKEIYIRQAISPAGLCLQGEVDDKAIADLLAICDQRLTQWITWVKEAEPVPEAERPALAARDAQVRRTICERDPANIVAERVLGAEMTQKLVNTLAGIGR